MWTKKEYVLRAVANCATINALNNFNDFLWKHCHSFYVDNVQWVNNLFIARERELRNDSKL